MVVGDKAAALRALLKRKGGAATAAQRQAAKAAGIEFGENGEVMDEKSEREESAQGETSLTHLPRCRPSRASTPQPSP